MVHWSRFGIRPATPSGYNFRVEIEGAIVGHFSEVQGLDAEAELVEYRDGDNEVVRERSGPGEIRLTGPSGDARGTHSEVLQRLEEWSEEQDRPKREEGTITVSDPSGEEIARWRFRSGWPCELDVSDTSVEERKRVVESLVLCHEGLDREK